MLKVVFHQHPVTLNGGITRHRLVFFHHLMSIATDTDARTIAIKGLIARWPLSPNRGLAATTRPTFTV
jgi:hypothetical protein